MDSMSVRWCMLLEIMEGKGQLNVVQEFPVSCGTVVLLMFSRSTRRFFSISLGIFQVCQVWALFFSLPGLFFFFFFSNSSSAPARCFSHGLRTFYFTCKLVLYHHFFPIQNSCTVLKFLSWYENAGMPNRHKRTTQTTMRPFKLIVAVYVVHLVLLMFMFCMPAFPQRESLPTCSSFVIHKVFV